MTVPQFVAGKTRIGWIGTGVMGSSMCGHLISAGFAATVYSRTKQRAEVLMGKERRGLRRRKRSLRIPTWFFRSLDFRLMSAK